MADGVQDSASGEIVEDISGGVSFEGRLPEDDALAARKVPAPDGVPEKFWDADKGALNTEALLKSYAELEKQFSSRSSSNDDDDGGDNEGTKPADAEANADDGADKSGEGDGEGDGSGEGEGDNADSGDAEAAPAAAEALTAAQNYFAEHGDLPAEARADLHKVGITDQMIDLQIAGVRAYEAALQSTAAEAAGEPYESVQEAIKWAAENWSPKKIAAFNAQSGDVETIGPAVAGLMKDYRKAVPSEGRLMNANGGVNRGDVYTSRGDFDKELAAAGNDRGERRKAIDKLNRSLKAGTIK